MNSSPRTNRPGSSSASAEEADEDLEEERDLMGEDYGDPDDDLIIVGNATDDYDD